MAICATHSYYNTFWLHFAIMYFACPSKETNAIKVNEYVHNYNCIIILKLY